MDKSLTRWYCDVCGKPIEDVQNGYVIWHPDHGKAHGFKIIHQKKCDQKNHHASGPLGQFVGPDGLAYLLAKLSRGPLQETEVSGSEGGVANFDEYVDFVRRVQTPYYEEARRRFGNEDYRQSYANSNEVLPYLEKSLKSTIENYSDSSQ